MSWRDYCNLIFLIIKQTNTFAGWNTESKSSTEGYVHHRAAGQDCHCGVWGKSNCFHVASQMWFLHAPHLYQSKKHRLVGISMRNVTIPDSIAILSSGLFKVFFFVIQISHTSKLNRSLFSVLFICEMNSLLNFPCLWSDSVRCFASFPRIMS